jgi:hypothetical protein
MFGYTAFPSIYGPSLDIVSPHRNLQSYATSKAFTCYHDDSNTPILTDFSYEISIIDITSVSIVKVDRDENTFVEQQTNAIYCSIIFADLIQRTKFIKCLYNLN